MTAREPDPVEAVKRTLSPAYWRLRTVLSGGERTVAINGASATVTTTDRMEHMQALTQHRERPVMERFVGAIERADHPVVWDVGANMGIFSLLAADAGARQVLAFEPDAEMAARASANVRRSGVDERVRVLPLGLGSGVKTATHEQNQWAREGARDVVLVSADQAVSDYGLPTPDILKVDVDGADLDVLDGAESVLDSARDIIFEVHPHKIGQDGADEVEARLVAREFEIAFRYGASYDHGDIYQIHATREESR